MNMGTVCQMLRFVFVKETIVALSPSGGGIVLEDEKILLTVKEFARVSGLGETCIRNLAHVEGFPALKNGRKVLIHRRAADKWLEEQACHAGTAV